MLSTVTTQPQTQTKSESGYLMPLITLGLTGIAIWKGVDWIKEWQSRKATEEAQKSTLKHELNIKRTQQKIAEIERKAYRTGINANKKTVSVNVVNEVQKIINGFFVVLTDSNGIKKYILKDAKSINAAQIKDAVFNTPLNSIDLLQKLYNIYTGRNFLSDTNKLPYGVAKQIETVLNVAQQKYGKK